MAVKYKVKTFILMIYELLHDSGVDPFFGWGGGGKSLTFCVLRVPKNWKLCKFSSIFMLTLMVL